MVPPGARAPAILGGAVAPAATGDTADGIDVASGTLRARVRKASSDGSLDRIAWKPDSFLGSICRSATP